MSKNPFGRQRLPVDADRHEMPTRGAAARNNEDDGQLLSKGSRNKTKVVRFGVRELGKVHPVSGLLLLGIPFCTIGEPHDAL
jgi:hypothetical protein